MTHSDRALYEVLGGSPLVERMWNGPKPVRALVFTATMVVITTQAVALTAADTALCLFDIVLRRR